MRAVIQKVKQLPLVIQMQELIEDIFGTILLALSQRRPAAKTCPIFMVKLFSIVPGLGHLFAGFYIRGVFWLIIALPIIVAFIFVIITEKFANLYTLHTLEAIGGMYIVLVFFCIRDVGHVVNAACSTERFLDYFKREKEISEKYRQFMQRHYNQKPADEEVEKLVLPDNKQKK
jgi:hypothetical protein